MPKEAKDSVMGSALRFAASLEANKDELAHLEQPIKKFVDLVTQAQEVAKEQAAFTAGKQESSKKLQELLAGTQRLATVIRVAIREHYGIRAEKLAEFGLQPFRGRNRKAKGGVEEGPQVEKPGTPEAPEAE